ncbi:transcription factor mef2A-like [Musca domestica]|uniref:Transcription factor mef2A-like n=1 Tax=Musca domestica TaxID=7370 RepID=A0ABM3UTF5_MUSDO|nr:transcription factor mef2A-like [Musca domestica]
MISLDSLSLATTKNQPNSVTRKIQTIDELLPEKVIICLPKALTEMTTNKCHRQQQQQQQQQQPEGQHQKQCQQQKPLDLLKTDEVVVIRGDVESSISLVADGNEDMIENLNSKSNNNNKRIPTTIVDNNTTTTTAATTINKGHTMAKQQEQQRQQPEPELSSFECCKTAMAKCNCGKGGNNNNNNTSYTTTASTNTITDINICNCISVENNGNINTAALNSVNNCVNNSNSSNNNNNGSGNNYGGDNNGKQEQQQLNLARTNKPNNVGFNGNVAGAIPPSSPPPPPPAPPMPSAAAKTIAEATTTTKVSHDTTNKSHHHQHSQSWSNAGMGTDSGILVGGGDRVTDSEAMPPEQALKPSTVVAALKSIGHNYGDGKDNQPTNTERASHSNADVWDSNSFAGGHVDDNCRRGDVAGGGGGCSYRCHPTNASNENNKHSTIQWNKNNNNNANEQSSSATVQCVLSTRDVVPTGNISTKPKENIDANALAGVDVTNVSTSAAATAVLTPSPEPPPPPSTTVIPTSFVMAELWPSSVLPWNGAYDNDNAFPAIDTEDPFFGNALENTPLMRETFNGPSSSDDSVDLMSFTEITNEPRAMPLMDSCRWENKGKK